VYYIHSILHRALPVAVDNHLLVAIPTNDGVASCHRLLELLDTEQTTSMLNGRIRCRHMTVAAIKDLPWPSAALRQPEPAMDSR
jgi:hypothetical protein